MSHLRRSEYGSFMTQSASNLMKHNVRYGVKTYRTAPERTGRERETRTKAGREQEEGKGKGRVLLGMRQKQPSTGRREVGGVMRDSIG